MKFEAFKKKIEVMTDNGTYHVRVPSIIELSKLAEAVKVAQGSDSDVVRVHVDFLEKLGLPKHESEALDAATFSALVKALTMSDEFQKKV